MTFACLLITCVLSAAPQERGAVTFGKVLGHAEIRRIVVNVLNEEVKTYNRAAAQGSDGPKELAYDRELPDVISERLDQSELPPDSTPEDAEVVLSRRFRRFVDHLVEYGRRNVAVPTLRLSRDLYERYMHRPLNEQKCGEEPCNRPPCCRYCEPPPCKGQ
jgi:hypothetical protein